MFIVLAFTFLSVAQASVIVPTVYLNINGEDYKFLIDINAADSFVVKTGTHSRKYGYNDTSNFNDLNEAFRFEISDNVNQQKLSGNGKIRIATKSSWKEVDRTATFGVVDKIEGNPTFVVKDDCVNCVGRLAMDPWRNGKTNLTDAWLRKLRPSFAYFVDCNEESTKCLIGQQLFECFSSDYVYPDTVVAPVNDNSNNYWQTEFAGYSIGKINVNRKLDVVFSTTTPDIHVPKNVFDYVVKQLDAKKEGDEYKFDCQNQRLTEDIVFNAGFTKLSLKARHYANFHQQKCTLRLRPTTGDFWVMGLPFYESYATCFDPNYKTIQFNTIIHRENFNLVNEEKSINKSVKLVELNGTK